MDWYDKFKIFFVTMLMVTVVIQISIIWQFDNEIDKLKSKSEHCNELSTLIIDSYITYSDTLVAELRASEGHVINLTTKHNQLISNLNDVDTKIVDLSEMYNNQINGERIISRPTYKEVVDFLARDHTDLKMYNDDYNCVGFSNELIRNAMDKGLFACSSSFSYLDGRGHRVVAFNTIDKGIIYVEPQTDDIMTKDLSVGDMYLDKKILKISSCFGVE